MLVDCPAQITVFPVTASVAKGITATFCVAVTAQPLVRVPAAVYVVETVGVMIETVPIRRPGIQVYVPAGVTVSEVPEPRQTVLAPAIVGGAAGVTDMHFTAVLIHPLEVKVVA